MARSLAFLLLLLALASPGQAELFVWVDAEGRTHVTDDREKIPARQRVHAAEAGPAIQGLWEDGIVGPPLRTPPGASGTEEDRTVRMLSAAVDDLGRGEAARASALLAQVLQRDPARPEAHWYLALLDRQRGRLDSAEAHLRGFLAIAGDEFAPWRASAQRRLRRLDDERRLLTPRDGELRLVSLASPNFRLQVDADLRRAGSPRFADTVMRYLEDARAEIGARLGVVPSEPLGVVLYGKAAYVKAHRHRFSFQTVGFFDGRIHVVSAAHPAGELRTLLFHEYTHALFREQTGGDRPFWLNEGMAELSERASKGLPPLSRSEQALLRREIDAGRWLPLESLAPSFGGLDNSQARLAYLESTAAAEWVERNLDRAGRARLLALLGRGIGDDEALGRVLGTDTAGVDAALRGEIRDRFPRSTAIAPAR